MSPPLHLTFPDMQTKINTILHGDALTVLKEIPDKAINCCVTSPPYWGLRDYGVDGQIGLEKTPEEYITKLVAIFREVKSLLRDDGTLWVVVGDSYAGSDGPNNQYDPKAGKSRKKEFIKYKNPNRSAINIKPKDLVGIPWMLAFALRKDGWYLRQDIIWNKPNPLPESVKDRCTKSHEYVFLLSKKGKYYYDADAIKELASYNTHERIAKAKKGHKSNPNKIKGGIRPRKPANSGVSIINNSSFDADMSVMPYTRNKRSVWSVTIQPCKEAHFAIYPEKLIEPMILAGCPKNGIVIDPFMGAGTTAIVAKCLNRNFIGIELNQKYIDIANKRIKKVQPLMGFMM